MKEMTWEEWNALPEEYRGLRFDPTVSGNVRPWALYLENGATVWGPVRIVEVRP